MSFWEEDAREQTIVISDEVVDLSFRIQCKALSADHGWALSRAVLAHLPWLQEEPYAALHQILVATSGNGWLSPDNNSERGEALLYPSRRTRLTLRLPKSRVDEAINTLNGTTLEIEPASITLSHPDTQLLSKLTTLYTRFAIFEADESEEQFLKRIRQQLAARDIYPRKMVCGRKNLLQAGHQTITTQSLMMADLTPSEALQLQQKGLDQGKDFGCGLFLPHKTVENQLQEQE